MARLRGLLYSCFTEKTLFLRSETLALSNWRLRLVLSLLLPYASLISVRAQTAAETAGPATQPEVPKKDPKSGSGKTTAQTPAIKPDEVQDSEAPVRSVVDPGVITTRQSITPAGVQAVFESRTYGVAFGDSSDIVYAVATSRKGALIYKLDWRANKVLQLSHAAAYPGMQAISFDSSNGSVLMSGEVSGTENGKRISSIGLISPEGNSAKVVVGHLGKNAVGGVAVAASHNAAGYYAVVPLTFDDEAAIVDLTSGALKTKVKTGVAPFGAAINQAATAAYVSNWGGRFPQPGDTTAPTGPKESADQAVVDARGIASSGTVSRIDVTTGTLTANIDVGLHPTSLAWDEVRNRLYVANSNSDSISVIDTTKNVVVETVALQLFDRNVAGISPDALVLSKDGTRLYAACAGINAVAVLSVGAKQSKIEGAIPTGWYPNHIAISPDGEYLVVSTLLGVGSGWKTAPTEQFGKQLGRTIEPGPTRRYVHSYRGTVHVIPVPDTAQLAGYSVAVAENNHVALKGQGLATAEEKRSVPAARPVPVRAGDPSPLEHIVYIIKENRSYDQMFGDLGKGNGDPSLQVYGDDVAPNQRKLAREFVLLDNFYATGGNSGDGHQWVTQASETDYSYWPGYGARSYPKNGDDPLAFANSGFIWDNAVNGTKTFADFGEFVGFIPKMQLKERMKLLEEYKSGNDFVARFNTVAPISPLNKWVAKDYPAYGLQVPDVVRARIFLRHLKQSEADDKMPNLVMLQLPSDHTSGTIPGLSTPKAEIADNDLALGQIVEGVSHSKFWKSTLILVVEDDAQDGLDHVDGHRTLALAISPYIRHGAIDSTFYSQPSMIKTIELILGLPTMSLFDLIANDMRNSFQQTPDLTPYDSVLPKQSIYEANPQILSLKGPAKTAALASMRMNFLIPDDVPTKKLNRILWHDGKGWGGKYPEGTKGVFLPSSDSTDLLCGKDDD
jgi:YVTN family beta-propeller protein